MGSRKDRNDPQHPHDRGQKLPLRKGSAEPLRTDHPQMRTIAYNDEAVPRGPDCSPQVMTAIATSPEPLAEPQLSQ
jgi:hypothetical protein